MEIREASRDRLVVSFDADEVAGLMNTMREALQAVEDWEFHALVGLDKSDIRAMRDQLREIYPQIDRP